MKLRQFSFIAVLLLAASIAGSGVDRDRSAPLGSRGNDPGMGNVAGRAGTATGKDGTAGRGGTGRRGSRAERGTAAGGSTTGAAHQVPAAGKPLIIDLNGLAGVRFGDTVQELARKGILQTERSACGQELAGLDSVSPIFVEDRLVLLWASPSTRTPEGVTEGTPIDRVHAAYPTATGLLAPKGTYRFDGLLAIRGDRAYLFLHDGRTVRKTIAGYADYARKLFGEGYNPC